VPYQVFQARDKYIIVAVGTPRLWTRFCEVLGISETVMNDPRFATNSDRLAHRNELIALVQEILAEREAEYWLEALREAHIPSGPINTVPETLAHPQLIERGFIVEQEHPLAGLVKSLANPIHFSETPAAYRLPPPALGEHKAEILEGLGYTSQEISQFLEKGIV
jgi:crotonobetainyl-CoA:carnitine CoA-transferase CaiB-like acyl-CoA transferase